MIAESSIGLINAIEKSVLIEALRVVLFETTPVDKTKCKRIKTVRIGEGLHNLLEAFLAGWRNVFKLPTGSASASCSVRNNLKMLLVICSPKEEAPLLDCSPTHAMVVAAEECPHGLAFPILCFANSPADDAFAIKQELEVHELDLF